MVVVGLGLVKRTSGADDMPPRRVTKAPQFHRSQESQAQLRYLAVDTTSSITAFATTMVRNTSETTPALDDLRNINSTNTTQSLENVAFILSALTAGGGITGYARTGSIPSVTAGVAVGALVSTSLFHIPELHHC